MSNFTENNGNWKKEILERSRNTIRDEGLVNAKLRGYKIGIVISSVVITILIGFSYFTWQITFIYAMSAIFFAPLIGYSIAVYKFTKKRIHLVTFICFTISITINSFLFIICVLRGV